MRPNTGASVVAPAAIMDRTQPSPACKQTISHNISVYALLEQHAIYWFCPLIHACNPSPTDTVIHARALLCFQPLNPSCMHVQLNPIAGDVEAYSYLEGGRTLSEDNGDAKQKSKFAFICL